MEVTTPRRMHRTLEPYHGMIYFVPEAADAYAAIGLNGRLGLLRLSSGADGCGSGRSRDRDVLQLRTRCRRAPSAARKRAAMIAAGSAMPHAAGITRPQQRLRMPQHQMQRIGPFRAHRRDGEPGDQRTRNARQWVEDTTDALMRPCWEPLGDDDCQRMRPLVRPWSTTLARLIA